MLMCSSIVVSALSLLCFFFESCQCTIVTAVRLRIISTGTFCTVYLLAGAWLASRPIRWLHRYSSLPAAKLLARLDAVNADFDLRNTAPANLITLFNKDVTRCNNWSASSSYHLLKSSMVYNPESRQTPSLQKWQTLPAQPRPPSSPGRGRHPSTTGPTARPTMSPSRCSSSTSSPRNAPSRP